MSQRNEEVLGTTLFKITNLLVSNQKICRALKYSNAEPFSDNLPAVDGDALINNQVLLVPKIPDNNEEQSYLTILIDKILVNEKNQEFELIILRIDVICPFNIWAINDLQLRPFVFLQEIKKILNNKRVAGLGTLVHTKSDRITVSPLLGGYSMSFKIDEFN